ncbi:radical SAM/SPASM domain-containing protein [Parerythrobacter aestuarii]|uniref:radical SAM/SPASM domain-containing protein n=1 Tax=Parerythrobacter aestuarii TaxID=3020909 RepID=UPI0024DED678|nr:radical SAM/SPASM domain-containing protein [Parerythrobacter aestuarii]
MGKPGLLAERVLPTEIEIEFISQCNANCVACPRDNLPAQGRLDSVTLERILAIRAAILEDYRPLADLPLDDLPRITIAGGGEPFLNSNAIQLLEQIKGHTENFHIITNASALTSKRIEELMEVAPASITCSFWGIAQDEYEAAMRLPYERSLDRVIKTARAARVAGVPFKVEWVGVPEIKSTDKEIVEFWTSRGVACGLTGGKLWNRADQLPAEYQQYLPDQIEAPDTSKPIWCTEVAFSLTFGWNGECLMCCCDYFNGSRIPLGSVLTDDWETLKQRKRAVLEARPIPPMCARCKLPRKDQAEWLVGSLMPLLQESDRALFAHH